MLTTVPIKLASANYFIDKHHRHHKGLRFHKFSVGIIDEEYILRGVAIAGRPIVPQLDDGLTLEISRICTDGVKNGCSKLISACWNTAKAQGYIKMQTYILCTETGASLKATGWKFVKTTLPKTWNTKKRKRIDKHPVIAKQRYEIEIKSSLDSERVFNSLKLYR